MNEILEAALIAGLIQMVEHWFPWRLILRRDLPRIPAYVLGVLGFVLPLTALYLRWERTVMVLGHWSHLLALWACVIASGLAVVLAYGIDYLADRVTRSYEHEERDEAASNGQ